MRYYPCSHPRGPSLGYQGPKPGFLVRLLRALIRLL